ncbi:hypothetical protein BH09ACT4_BH09ACT4_10650 [soil metagenome]
MNSDATFLADHLQMSAAAPGCQKSERARGRQQFFNGDLFPRRVCEPHVARPVVQGRNAAETRI